MSRLGPLGGVSGVEHGSRIVRLSDVYPVQQRRQGPFIAAGSHTHLQVSSVKRCDAPVLLAASAGGKCVWLSQSFCQYFIHNSLRAPLEGKGEGLMQ